MLGRTISAPAFLRSEGKKVICNSTGSNMLQGVTSAFVFFVIAALTEIRYVKVF